MCVCMFVCVCVVYHMANVSSSFSYLEVKNIRATEKCIQCRRFRVSFIRASMLFRLSAFTVLNTL